MQRENIENSNKEQQESIVIRFSGDSGDGMQLTGTQFSSTSALMGNDISTFPDFPAEIRAPQGTIAGISGFQVNFGSTEINTPGDEPDVLVAMNPAALKANLKDLRKGITVIINTDAFTALNLDKAGYSEDPLDDGTLNDFNVIKCPITTQTKKALEDIELDIKSKERCKNFYALGITYYLFSRDLTPTLNWIEDKFYGKMNLIEANSLALKAGFNYADTIEAIHAKVEIKPASIEKGTYRQINGNTATAWGFIYASENADTNLFLGSYPITPASDVLHELSKHKDLGVITFQAEDEIAAICSAIGASFGGNLGITTSSGPGIALKGEALGLAIVYELPLVVVDIQRGGPSTGLPTKTEQSDLNLAMYGRNGESPAIVLAAKTPSDCFHMAYMAAKLSMEHMTPVILLTDGYLANGSEPWLIPDIEKFPKINPPRVKSEDYAEEKFLAYKRDEKLVRKWAHPGMENLTHRIGGLEKQVDTGNVSYDPANHQEMVRLRAEKVAKVADFIPEQSLEGDKDGDVLIVSWGGTYGATHQAVHKLRAQGKKVGLMHMQYLNPMPKNTESILKSYKKIIVCELNCGQLKNLLNSTYNVGAIAYNKVQGQPFKIRELVQMVEKELENK